LVHQNVPETPNDMKEMEAIISGRVQGINYRSFVHKKANALWLSGYVENMPNRNVRVVSQGSEEKLRALVEHLWKGPFSANVSNVLVTWCEPTQDFNDFSIRY